MSKSKLVAFCTTIEADHSAIQALARRLRRAYQSLDSPTSTPESSLSAIKDEIIWRLIRHANSEHRVPRPAFVRYLGDHGRAYVDGDRQDHGDAKQQLIPLLPLSPTSDKFRSSMLDLLTELQGHMERETGWEIPLLESKLSSDLSQRLADLYDKTLILTPQLTWGQLRRAREQDSLSHDDLSGLGAGHDDEMVFVDLATYVFTPSERMRALLGWPQDLLQGWEASSEWRHPKGDDIAGGMRHKT